MTAASGKLQVASTQNSTLNAQCSRLKTQNSNLFFMIILITGASHTGKTLLAQKLLEQYHYPYLSMDHVKMGLIRAGLVDARPDDTDEALTAVVWPVVRETVKTAVENGQNLIVEGCYVPAGWERDFAPEYLKEIKFRCLVMTERYIRAHFGDIKARASAIEQRGDDGDFTLDAAVRENARFLAAFGGSDGLTLIDDKYELPINTEKGSFRVIPYEETYRDDMIFTVLSAKNALGRVPRLNPDLLSVKEAYFEKGGFFWLAVDPNDRVVGCVGCSAVEGSDEAVLHRLYVKPEFKRRGIGSALLSAAEEYLKAQGRTAVRVHLGEPRETWFESYAFYPKHGYAEYAPGYMRKEFN